MTEPRDADYSLSLSLIPRTPASLDLLDRMGARSVESDPFRTRGVAWRGIEWLGEQHPTGCSSSISEATPINESDRQCAVLTSTSETQQIFSLFKIFSVLFAV